MRLLRAILVATCAAVAGDLTTALLLSGSIDHWQIALFPFGILGALLLPLIHGWVHEEGYSSAVGYLAVAAAGPLAGWLMLLGSPIGACYGAVTTAYWIVFDLGIRWLGRIARATQRP